MKPGGPDLGRLRSALRERGLRCSDLTPFSRGASRFVAGDGQNVVVRCSLAGTAIVSTSAAEIEWALRFGAQVPVQAPALPDPFDVDGWAVTAWQYLRADRDTGPADAEAHGRLLRAAHDTVALTAAESLSAVDQMRVARLHIARLQIARLPSRSPALARALTNLVDHAQEILNAETGSELVAAHGDAQDQNLLVHAGQLTLIDFDSAGPAPRSLDVACAVRAYQLHFGDQAAATRFLHGYGADTTVDVAAIPSLVWVRSVRSVCSRAYDGEEVGGRIESLVNRRPWLR